MNLGTIAKGVEQLSEADAVIADQYLQAFVFRVGVYALAGTLAVSGLALWELSLFWLLEPKIGPMLASTTLGAINCVAAAFLLLLAKFKPQAAELALAIKLRHSAISQIQQELSANRNEGSLHYARSAVELAGALLVPMALALVRSIRPRSDVSRTKEG